MKRENTAVRLYTRQLIFLAVIFGLPLIVSIVIVIIFFPNELVRWLVPIILFVLPLPFVIYNIVQIVHYSIVLFEKIQIAKVVEFKMTTYSRSGISFVLFVKVKENGEEKIIMTKRVFGHLEEYTNSIGVEVGFDPKRHEWIVLE